MRQGFAPRPFTFRPKTVCDSADATNSPPGAMRSLANLIPDPQTLDMWVPRPGSPKIADFAAFVAAGFNNPGFISGRLIVGDIEYGMIATQRFPGYDEPYAFNLASGTFLTLSGVSASNLPISQSATGPWFPPILCQVGSRVVVTHIGFPGSLVKFGWFDLSALRVAVFGNTNNGLANQANVITGSFSTFGIQPGLIIAGSGIATNSIATNIFDNPSTFATTGSTTTGSTSVTVSEITGFIPTLGFFGLGIPAGATIVARSAFSGAGTVTISVPATVTASGSVLISSGVPPFQVTTTQGSTVVAIDDSFASDCQCYAVGQGISGANFAQGTTITGVNTGTQQLTLSIAATFSGALTPTITGNTLVLNNNATAAATGVSMTLFGGTRVNPLWGAGDCTPYPLPSVPIGVALLAGRAYFACGLDGIPFSDSGLPSRRANANQALLPNDGLAVTAVASQYLGSPLTGGIVQSIIAFEGATKLQQITGDQTLGNLTMNALPVATGTLAPLSICSTQRGLAFVSPQGLRFIGLLGDVSNVVGEGGTGITLPFTSARFPSRICAAVNDRTLRITTQPLEGPAQEWWYDLDRQLWSGPHSSAASIVQAWRNTFVISPIAPLAQLWQSDPEPSATSIYTENGVALSWTYEPSLFPDTGTVSMVEIKDMTLSANLALAGTITATAVNDLRQVLDTSAPLSSDNTTRERAINWHLPILWRQGTVQINGNSGAGVRLGNLYSTVDPQGTFIVDQNTVTPAPAPPLPPPTEADDMNFLINGAMQIDQANEGASITLTSATLAFLVDGWNADFISGTAAVSVQRVADGPLTYPNSIKMTVGTGETSIAATDFLHIWQAVEANAISGIGFGTAQAAQLQLSFWAKVSIANYTACGTLRNAAGTRSYPFNFTIASANTWTLITVPILADAGGAWVTSGTASGLLVGFTPALGSNYVGGAAAWSAGNFLGTASCTNTILTTTNATFQVTVVKLEINTVATVYAQRDPESELALCQRYYEKSYNLGVALGATSLNGGENYNLTSGSVFGPGMRFKVPKRATPSVTLYSPGTGTAGFVRDVTGSNDVAATVANIGFGGASVNCNGVSGNHMMWHWTADARIN